MNFEFFKFFVYVLIILGNVLNLDFVKIKIVKYFIVNKKKVIGLK